MQEPLKSLHSDSALSKLKLEQIRKLSTEDLIDTLKPGGPNSLRTRPDGTIIEGHHRVKVLRERGVNVDLLPRDVTARD